MKQLFTIVLTVLLATTSVLAKEIQSVPGGLGAEIGRISASDARVSISGEADARDLSLLRSFPEGVEVLDLQALDIKAFTDTKPRYFNHTFFEAGQIPAFCFFATAYTEVKLPAKTAIISKGAFAGAAITRVRLPESTGYIADYAFYDCPNLTAVTLPAGLTTLGKGAFANCKRLTTIDLSQTLVTEIPEGCFAGCTSLRQIILPPDLMKIGREAFRGTSIRALDLENIDQLEPYALSGMEMLERVTLNSSARFGEGTLMDNTMLKTLTGTPGNIPPLFAANCGSLDAQSALGQASTLGDYAFANTTSQGLVLSPGLTKIDRGVFAGMSGLEEIDADGLGPAIPDVEPDAFYGIDCPKIKLHVTDESYDAWKAHPQWGEFNIVSNSNVSVDGISGDAIIRISCVGSIVKVSATEAITRIDVYSLDGRRIQGFNPGDTEAEITIAETHGSVMLVEVKTKSTRKTAKIIMPLD